MSLDYIYIYIYEFQPEIMQQIRKDIMNSTFDM